MSSDKKKIKHEKFKNILTRRLTNLANQFRLISNLSNKSNYYYEVDELEQMFDKIEHLVELLKHDFNYTNYN